MGLNLQEPGTVLTSKLATNNFFVPVIQKKAPQNCSINFSASNSVAGTGPIINLSSSLINSRFGHLANI